MHTIESDICHWVSALWFWKLFCRTFEWVQPRELGNYSMNASQIGSHTQKVLEYFCLKISWSKILDCLICTCKYICCITYCCLCPIFIYTYCIWSWVVTDSTWTKYSTPNQNSASKQAYFIHQFMSELELEYPLWGSMVPQRISKSGWRFTSTFLCLHVCDLFQEYTYVTKLKPDFKIWLQSSEISLYLIFCGWTPYFISFHFYSCHVKTWNSSPHSAIKLNTQITPNPPPQTITGKVSTVQ